MAISAPPRRAQLLARISLVLSMLTPLGYLLAVRLRAQRAKAEPQPHTEEAPEPGRPSLGDDCMSCRMLIVLPFDREPRVLVGCVASGRRWSSGACGGSTQTPAMALRVVIDDHSGPARSFSAAAMCAVRGRQLYSQPDTVDTAPTWITPGIETKCSPGRSAPRIRPDRGGLGRP